MFYMATVILGWFIINFFLNLINSFLEIDSFNNYVFFYILIGYIIMSLKKIPSPLNNNKVTTPEDTPFKNIKSIEINLFFKELYYAAWWPYYLLRKN